MRVASDTKPIFRFIRIVPNRRDLKLEPDLPPLTVDAMIGHPPPELREIKGWKNGPPVTLAALRGKVVILDFWGYWCSPCCGAMPDLMKLQDRFKDQGLVIIAVHNDTAASIADMDQKLEKTRKEMWGGRDLPFLVALDGGGSRRIQYTSQYADGATTAQYGIYAYPTTLIIGRDGNLIGDFFPGDPHAGDQIRKLLQSPPDAGK